MGVIFEKNTCVIRKKKQIQVVFLKKKEVYRFEVDSEATFCLSLFSDARNELKSKKKIGRCWYLVISWRVGTSKLNIDCWITAITLQKFLETTTGEQLACLAEFGNYHHDPSATSPAATKATSTCQILSRFIVHEVRIISGRAAHFSSRMLPN